MYSLIPVDGKDAEAVNTNTDRIGLTHPAAVPLLLRQRQLSSLEATDLCLECIASFYSQPSVVLSNRPISGSNWRPVTIYEKKDPVRTALAEGIANSTCNRSPRSAELIDQRDG